MKRLLISLTILAIAFSCQMPDEKEEKKDSSIELKYDTGSLYMYSPSNDTNAEYAIRLPSYNKIRQYAGRRIKTAKVYLRVIPTSVRVKIYQCDYDPDFPYTIPDSEANGGYPGFGDSSLLANQLFNTSNHAFSTYSWNSFNLSNVVTLPSNKDIWVVIEITDNATAGYAQICSDGGPGYYDANYYRLTVGTGTWLNTLLTRNANMMIRAVIE